MQSRTIILQLIAMVSFSSCATRLSCSPEAPSLSPAESSPLLPGDLDVRVTRYIAGTTRNGLTITEVSGIRDMPSCGMDLMASALTLGLIPYASPNPMEATVSGTVGGRKVTRTYRIAMERHTSIWHRLIPPVCDRRAIARGILQAIDHELSAARFR
jgi:hypothetical protein